MVLVLVLVMVLVLLAEHTEGSGSRGIELICSSYWLPKIWL